MNPLYLGLDCSTQSLTAMLLEIDGGARVVFEHSLEFDAELPHYGTRHGVLPSDDPAVAVSPPLLWAEALEQMFEVMVDAGPDLSGLAAVSGSAQQHGSVYLNRRAGTVLAALDPEQGLAAQLGGTTQGASRTRPSASRAISTADSDERQTGAGIFSRPVAPIWMDSSTSLECAEITRAMGGAERLARITGSRAFERFTGPQIRKFSRRDPKGWESTARVHMVSSFVASLLAGAEAPLDPGDASGTNLMDLATRGWCAEAVAATAPDLAAKLPPIVPSSSVVGAIAPYWRQRFGLPAARLVAFSGDNPCSLVGTGLIREGRIAVSLGTSDTIFGPMREPRVDGSGTGHVFGAPTGDYMGLTCFLNGSLARQRIRDQHGLDWEGFSATLRDTPPGNDGALMFPWFEPEITPHVPGAAVRRVDLDPADGRRNVRAVVEAQMMALAIHSRWMGVDIDTIHATGGAAVNAEILQVMADVFDAQVHRFEAGNSACLGAALRAWHADAAADGDPVDWQEVVRGVAEPVAGSTVLADPTAVAVYERQRRRYAKLEALAIGGCATEPASG